MTADHARAIADYFATMFDQESAHTGLNTIDDIVEFYKREYPKRIQRLRSTPGEQLAKEVDFFGMTKGPVDLVSGARQQPWHPSPRPVDDLPSGDGFESAVDLRR
jgi:hypothetical protein